MPRLAPLFFCAAACSAWALTPQETEALIRKATSNLMTSFDRTNDFGFLRYSEHKEYSSDGKLKSYKSWKVRREEQDGFFVGRLLERDGKPLSDADRAKNEEAIRKRLAELKAMTPEERAALKAKQKKNGSNDEEWVKELPDAVSCQLIGEESVASRDAWKFDCSPRKGYQPKNMRARVFEKMNSRLWIDKQDSEMIRADAEMFDEVNIGFGILGHINKGTQFTIERTKIGSTWLPVTEHARFNVRLMLVKSMNQEMLTRYQDFVPRSTQTASTAAK